MTAASGAGLARGVAPMTGRERRPRLRPYLWGRGKAFALGLNLSSGSLANDGSWMSTGIILDLPGRSAVVLLPIFAAIGPSMVVVTF
jgi:hypothetical protein